MSPSIVGAPGPGNGFTVPALPNPADGGWLYTNGTEAFGATDLQAGDLLVWQGLASDVGAGSAYDQLYGLDVPLTQDGVAWDIDVSLKWLDATIGAAFHLILAHRYFVSAPSSSYWAQLRADSSSGSNFDSSTMLKIRDVASNPAFHGFTPDGPFTSAPGVVNEAYPNGRYFVFPVGTDYYSRVIGGNYDAMGGLKLFSQAVIGHTATIGSVYADAAGASDVTDYGLWTPYTDAGAVFGAGAYHYALALTDSAPASAVYVSGRRSF